MNPPKDPILAAILSVLIPGLGQFYCLQWVRGAMFLVGAIIMAMIVPPLSLVVWIWGAVDAYRIAKVLQGYDQTAEGPIIDIGKLRMPHVDLRSAIPYIGIPLGIVIVLVIVISLVLARYGFWSAGPPRGTLQPLIEKIENYKAHTGSYPDSLEVLIDRTDPIEKKQILDQWGNVYLLRTTGSSFELLSAGQDGHPGTEDDVRYQP
ncbi:MAG: type II secretion system protein GspG [Deltaproteobacteria bacterium]|nr:type II secretion system protein GspG [Deltaproteobacteria bacterium]